MQTFEPNLSEHPFLRGLKPYYIEIITGCASDIKFESGQFILREGEEANNFYIILHGKVALEIFTPERGSITIQTIGDGEVLGWSWLIPPYLWRFDARAVELTHAIALDGKCLRAKCEQDHELGYELLKRFTHVIAKRLEATRFQLLDVYGIHT